MPDSCPRCLYPRFLAAVVLVIGMMGSGCDWISSDSAVVPGRSGVYAGPFSQGIEDSVFDPCGREEVWKIVGFDADTTFGRRVWEQLRAGENPMFVRLQGIPTARGAFEGIFVTYDREFALEEALEVRPLQETDC